MESYESKSLPTEIGGYSHRTNDVGQEVGVLSGLASAWTVDRVNDQVVKGAFAGAKTPLPFLYQHQKNLPIGAVKSLRETDAGLEFEAELILAVPEARSCWELCRANVIRQTSIGYRVPKGGAEFVKTTDPETKQEKRIRRLRRVDLFEVSAVTIPAQPDALIRSVKSDSGFLSPDEFRDALIEAGSPETFAKMVVDRGYVKALKAWQAGAGPSMDMDTTEVAQTAVRALFGRANDDLAEILKELDR